MRVLLCGYYGEHNLGDDALLQVLLAELPPRCTPVVTAHDQEAVRARFQVATTDRRRLAGVLRELAGCDALVLGGGSLLQDATSFRSLLYYGLLMVQARRRGKPVLLWGQGLGPLRRRRSRLLARALLPLATGISWRDPASARLAAGWGIGGALGSDPVWGLPPGAWRGGDGPIVVCWRPVGQLSGRAWSPYLQALESLAVEAGREVLWLPFHQEQDRGLLARLQAEGLVGERLARRCREVEAADPDAARFLFEGAGLVLAMRLHGLILAALAGSPCAALSYDPKVEAAAGAIGCPCQDLAAPPDPGLLESWRGQLGRSPDAARIQAQREATAVHRRLLDSLAP